MLVIYYGIDSTIFDNRIPFLRNSKKKSSKPSSFLQRFFTKFLLRILPEVDSGIAPCALSGILLKTVLEIPPWASMKYTPEISFGIALEILQRTPSEFFKRTLPRITVGIRSKCRSGNHVAKLWLNYLEIYLMLL